MMEVDWKSLVCNTSSYSKLCDKMNGISLFKDYSEEKKVAIFCIYISNKRQFSYQKKIYNWLKENNYFVVLVHPEVTNISDDIFSSYCDVLIRRENFGYDFGSYASGLIYLLENSYFGKVEDLLFINDSVIGPFNNGPTINSKAEFWANTDSHQLNYHFQSYLFGFLLSSKNRKIVLDFFFNRGDIYTDDKMKVINNFELSMYDFFYKNGLNCRAIYASKMLKSKFKERLFSNLRTPNLLRKSKYYLDILYRDINPTHHLWLELFDAGFTFVKKELIRDNPTGYPCLNQKIEYEMDKLDSVIEYKKIIEEIF